MILSSWGSPSLDAPALAAAPRLRALVHAAGSVKPYVTEALWRREIVVSSAAAANAIPVAEFTLAMILLANKRAFRLARSYRQRRARLDLLAEVPEAGNYAKTVGIVGASRIGRRVIELLRPHDLSVLVSDPYLDAATARTRAPRAPSSTSSWRRRTSSACTRPRCRRRGTCSTAGAWRCSATGRPDQHGPRRAHRRGGARGGAALRAHRRRPRRHRAGTAAPTPPSTTSRTSSSPRTSPARSASRSVVSATRRSTSWRATRRGGPSSTR